MAPSRENLVEFFNFVVHYNLTPTFIKKDGELRRYKGRQILALLCYMIKVDFIQPDDAVSRFLEIAPDFLSEYKVPDESNHCYISSSFDKHMARELFESVVSLMPELQKFFRVQQFSESALEKSEVVAAFMDFLAQIFDCSRSKASGFIKKELRFLVFVLGDAPFISNFEESETILDEFELVANLAGDFVYSYYFTRYAVDLKEIEEVFYLLFERIVLLKSRIENHCIKASNLGNCGGSHTTAIDSLFIVDSLLDDLEDLINGKYELVLIAKDEMKELYDALLFLRSLVKEMKVPFNMEIKELRELLLQMRDAAYESEYVINSFISKEFPLWYLTLRLNNIVLKIKHIDVTPLSKVKRTPRGYSYHSDASDVSQVKKSPPFDEFIVGFEDKENEILEKLIGVPKHLQVLTIHGMPGLGKTTLAKRLFNHPSIAYYFDKYVWVVVSQTYHKRELMITILSSLILIDRVAIEDMDEDSLATQIYQTLKGRRYMVVMDDMWDSTLWDDLRRYFPEDRNGSRILFTSRNKDIAPPSSVICTIPLLSEDQCWKLIEKKVFSDEVCPPHLLSIGKQIAANCNGLPLATVAIAGILAKENKEECIWKEVEKRMSSFIIADKETSCMYILELSYRHLPDHLKPCFLYFGALSECAKVSIKRLIALWISEGFVRNDKAKCLENAVEDYLGELIDRSLVLVDQHTSTGGVKSCHVHDLWRELCLVKVKEENFLKLIKTGYSICERHHRLSLNCDYNMGYTPRSLFFRQPSRPFGLHIRSILGQLGGMSFCFPSIKLIKILDLLIMPSSFTSNFDEIGLLVHLRYLAMKANDIPNSICNLVRLEFFVVDSSSDKVILIPAWLLNLGKLRHLHARIQANFAWYCDSSPEVNNLLTLSFVRITELIDVSYLRCSPNLRQLKCVCASLFPDLRFLVQLDTLNMQFTRSFEGTYADINFPMNIRKLTLSGLRLPWKEISTIGRLPNLVVLKLEKNSFVGKTWTTCDDEFLQLKVLKLKNLTLEEWNASSDHFPMLQRVVLVSCYNLMSIPTELGDLATMQCIEIKWCNNVLKESALQIQEEQHDSGNTDFKVIAKETFSENSELNSTITKYLINLMIGKNIVPKGSLEYKMRLVDEFLNDGFDFNDGNMDIDEVYRMFQRVVEDYNFGRAKRNIQSQITRGEDYANILSISIILQWILIIRNWNGSLACTANYFNMEPLIAGCMGNICTNINCLELIWRRK